MGYASRAGHAITNPQAPRAQGVCDRCGFWYQLHKLRYQYEWHGTQQINTRKRVCHICWDVSNPQMRARLMPPDPVPVYDPRPEPWLLPGYMDRLLATEDDSRITTETGPAGPGKPIEIEP
jgi:hypothetical protein